MNPKLSLIDTHCDTAYELFHRGEHLDRNSCHIDLEKASCYQHYAQYFAVWSNKRLDDEACWQDFLKITDYFQAELDRLSDRAVQVRTGAGRRMGGRKDSRHPCCGGRTADCRAHRAAGRSEAQGCPVHDADVER